MSSMATSVLEAPSVDPNMEPSQEDVMLANQVRQLWREAKKERESLIGQWRFYYELLTNEKWSPGRSPWQQPNTNLPEMWPIVSAMVAWMTDQRPRFNISPACDPFTEYAGFMGRLAQDLSTVMDANWHIYKQDAEIEKMLWDAFTYGIGILKTTWDSTLEQGLGNAVFGRTDPFTFYVDPRAKRWEQANYFLEVSTISLQELDRRFPGSAKKLMNVAWDEPNVDEQASILTNIGTSPVAANAFALNGGSATEVVGTGKWAESALIDRGVTIIEAWLREHRHQGNKTVDGWRCVVVCGNQILMDEKASDMWEHGQHPYTRYVLTETGQLYGKGLVELLAPAQLELNFLLSAFGINIRLTGNPIMVEDDDANTQGTRISGRAGQRLTKRKGSEISYLIPPEVHPQVAGTLIQFYKGEMENISGLSAITRGFMPTGRNSADVMDSVQDAGFVRIRLAMRNLERTLSETGQLIGSLIVELYDEDRILAITGDTGRQSALVLKGAHFYVPSKKGRIPLKFSLLVDAGSSTPTSMRARIAEADTLYAMGALDVPAILEIHKVPNRDQIWERIKTLMASGMWNPPGARQRSRR